MNTDEIKQLGYLTKSLILEYEWHLSKKYQDNTTKKIEIIYQTLKRIPMDHNNLIHLVSCFFKILYPEICDFEINDLINYKKKNGLNHDPIKLSLTSKGINALRIYYSGFKYISDELKKSFDNEEAAYHAIDLGPFFGAFKTSRLSYVS